MTDTDVRIERTALDGWRSRLRPRLVAYFAEADERAVAHFPETLDGLDVDAAAEADLDRLADPALSRPLFLALGDDDRIVGTVQLKRLDERTAEVKRLYVDPARRGEGVGRRLMERLIAAADDDGFETLRLGVAPYLERARALYEALGFEETDRYEHSNAPETLTAEWRFMALSLADR